MKHTASKHSSRKRPVARLAALMLWASALLAPGAGAAGLPVTLDVSQLSGDPAAPTILHTFSSLDENTVLTFRLNAAPAGELTFADIVFHLALADGTLLSDIEFQGSGNGDGPVDHGLQSGVSSLDLFNVTLWAVSVGPNPLGQDVVLSGLSFIADGPFPDFSQTLEIDTSAVPLPGALMFMVSGLAGLGCARRSVRRHAGRQLT